MMERSTLLRIIGKIDRGYNGLMSLEAGEFYNNYLPCDSRGEVKTRK